MSQASLGHTQCSLLGPSDLGPACRVCPVPPGHTLRRWAAHRTPGICGTGAPKKNGTSYGPQGLWGQGPAGGVGRCDQEACLLRAAGGSGWVRPKGTETLESPHAKQAQ